MKKILFITSLVFALSFTCNAQGIFPKGVLIQNVLLTAAKILSYEATKAKVDNAVPAGNSLVLKGDSLYRKTGSYVPMHEYRTKPNSNNELRVFKERGSNVKTIPETISGFSSAYTMSDGEVIFSLHHIKDTISIDTLKYMLSVASTGATFDGVNAGVIYYLNGVTATKLVESANSGTTWTQTAFTPAFVKLPSTTTLIPGYYLIGLSFNTSVLGTAPKIYTADQGLLTTLSQKQVGWAVSKLFASFPASFDITTSSSMQFVVGIFGF